MLTHPNMWQSFSDRLFLGANLKVWTKATDRSLFRLDFAPATEGKLEISQGDGSLTIGQPIIISADSSPIVITLPLPILIATDKRRLSLRASKTLRVSLSVLEIEPVFNINENMSNSQNSNICNSFTIESTTQFTTFLAANSNRKFVSITNNSDSTLYIDYDNEVSAENHAVRIPPFYYFEMPIGIQTKVVGLWDRVDGSAFIREFT